MAFEKEVLTPEQQYNEYLLTGLRTIWGCDLRKIEDIDLEYKNHFLKLVSEYLDAGQMMEKNGVYSLTKAGKLLADRIAMELFKDEE